MPTWDAQLYLRFAEERTQPARDLVARIALADPRRVIDLGCGPGNSTALLHTRWPAADIAGLDSSPEMVATARQTYPRWRWEQADIATWSAQTPYDLVFSNATLQWLPDHAALFPRLLEQVIPGGALAVQVPVVVYSPIRTLMADLSRDPRWSDRMDAARASLHGAEPGVYYDALAPRAVRVDLWQTEYLHVLAGPAAIVDWIRGTGLRPYLEALASDDERRVFLDELLVRVTTAYPPQADGKVIFPFRRLFVVAYR